MYTGCSFLIFVLRDKTNWNFRCLILKNRVMQKVNHLRIRLVAIILVLSFFSGITDSCKKISDGPVTNEVIIEGMAFSPATITVTHGTTITWKNNDSADHTVSSNIGLFDSGTINPAGTYSRVFTMTGTFPYRCTIHPSMTGTVIVN